MVPSQNTRKRIIVRSNTRLTFHKKDINFGESLDLRKATDLSIRRTGTITGAAPFGGSFCSLRDIFRSHTLRSAKGTWWIPGMHIDEEKGVSFYSGFFLKPTCCSHPYRYKKIYSIDKLLLKPPVVNSVILINTTAGKRFHKISDFLKFESKPDSSGACQGKDLVENCHAGRAN
ncbi:MAG: hypothetical protein JXA25_14725 [Anaerolineales bacterium]|nr:hypothetical protein [Anaerolineales bacterium]